MNINDNISIFICAHKQFNENVFPLNDMYTILYQNDLNFIHKSISLDNDEFCKNNKKLYSEGCGLYYLYKHQELLKDYVVFCHYRRYFQEFINKEENIITYINKYNCLTAKAYNNPNGNYEAVCHNLSENIANKIISYIDKLYPEYNNCIQKWKDNKYQNGFNICGMKKENFIQMCEFCLNILDQFAKEYNITGDNDINDSRLTFNIFSQSRGFGYILEYLTDIFYKYNFNNIYESDLNCRFWHTHKNMNTAIIIKYYSKLNLMEKHKKYNNYYITLDFLYISLIPHNKNILQHIEENNLDIEYILICDENNYLELYKHLNITDFIQDEMVKNNYKCIAISDEQNNLYKLYKIDHKQKITHKIEDLNNYTIDNICDKSIACIKKATT